MVDVKIENTGVLDPVSLFALTGGVRMSREWEGLGRSLIVGEGSVRVRDELVREFDGLGIAVFQDDVVAAAEFENATLGGSLMGASLPLGEAEEQAVDERIHAVELGGEFYVLRYFEVGREQGSTLLVAAAQQIDGATIVDRVQRQAGLLSIALVLPLLLFYVLDAATRIARLRLRLTTLLVTTSLVPIVVLFAVLYNVVAGDRVHLRESRARASTQEVKGRLDGVLSSIERTAREIMESEVVSEARHSRELDRTRIEAYLEEVVALEPAPGVDLAVRLEVETAGGQRVLFHDRQGCESMSRFDVMRSGVQYHWDELVVQGVEERRGNGLNARVSVAGVIGPGWVADVSRATEGVISLLSLSGWPIGGDVASDIGTRLKAAERVREENRVVFRQDADGTLVASDLLRDDDGVPIAMVEAVLPQDAFLLNVPLARVRLANFFFWFCIIGLVVAVFMGAVATRRITGPIEVLERAVHQVARGDLEVDLAVETKGEVGQLAQSFASMTAQLRERSVERDRIERAMTQLTRSIDLDATAAAALDALAESPPAQSAVLYRNDPDRTHLELLGSRGSIVPPFANALLRTSAVQEVLDSGSPRVLSVGDESEWGLSSGSEAGPADRTGGPERYTLLLPLMLSGKSVGLAVLRYGNRVRQRELDGSLAILQHLAGQAAVSLENARLYRLAVADPVTGLYVDGYCKNRLAEEVDRAQHGAGRVALVRVEVDGLGRLERQYGLEKLREALQQLARCMKAEVREMYLVSRSEDAFSILLPETGRAEAAELGWAHPGGGRHGAHRRRRCPAGFARGRRGVSGRRRECGDPGRCGSARPGCVAAADGPRSAVGTGAFGGGRSGRRTPVRLQVARHAPAAAAGRARGAKQRVRASPG